MIRLRRGPRVDSVLWWLHDKPLPEDERWPDGTELSNVIAIEQRGHEWVIDAGLTAPDIPESDALDVLREEVENGLDIHRDMLGGLTPDDVESKRDIQAAAQILRRVLDAINEEKERA